MYMIQISMQGLAWSLQKTEYIFINYVLAKKYTVGTRALGIAKFIASNS